MYRFLWLFLCAFFVTTSAFAQLDSNEPPKVQAMLVSDVASIELGKPFTIALKQTIDTNWHTYWRNPGDTGLATAIKWDLPSNFKASDILWPVPQQIKNEGLMTYGYEGDVMLLTTITAPKAMPEGKKEGDLITFKAKATWLVCHDICLPEQAELQLSLPIKMGAAENTSAAASIEAFKARMPTQAPTPLKTSISQNILQLSLPVPSVFNAADFKSAYFYPYDGLLINHAAPQDVAFNGQDLSFSIPLNTARSEPVDAIDGIVQLNTTQGMQVLEVSNHVVATPTIKPVLEETAPPTSVSTTVTVPAEPMPTPANIGFLAALGLAFMGGLILNLMPCVLPVLSIKALSLLNKVHGTNRQAAMWSGVAYTSGVLASFTLLAAVLLGLRATGQHVGWGVQLQSPLFVASMACIMFVLGLLFAGLLTLGQNLMGVGQNLTQKSGWAGSFFTGVLAVVVATPCTAPFMGGAIFYALSQPVVVAVAVLLALGFGLALPYLLLSFYPQLLRFLPKPGAWMETFKQVLAFPMFAAAIWLVWVLAQQAGPEAVGRVLLAMLALAFAAFVWGRAAYASKTKRLWLVLLITFTLGLGLLAVRDINTNNVPTTATSANYEAFTPQKLAALRAANKPVFIDLTAAWCITCLANEKAALNTDTVQSFFKANNITFLKGDWTNYNPDITALLKQFGRNGVPLYVFYPSNQKAPIVLPQLLTPQIVVDNITASL